MEVYLDEEQLKRILREVFDSMGLGKLAQDSIELEKRVLVSRREASRRLSVSYTTLWRWDREGFLPVSSRIGKAVFYSEESLRRVETGGADPGTAGVVSESPLVRPSRGRRRKASSDGVDASPPSGKDER